jgi:hypothetical protein
MNLIRQKINITEGNFKMIDIGSVIIHGSTLYDIYSVKGDSWSNLVIAGISRTANQPSRIQCFSPHSDNLVMLNTNILALLQKSFIQSLISLFNMDQMVKSFPRYKRA